MRAPSPRGVFASDRKQRSEKYEKVKSMKGKELRAGFWEEYERKGDDARSGVDGLDSRMRVARSKRKVNGTSIISLGTFAQALQKIGSWAEVD